MSLWNTHDLGDRSTGAIRTRWVDADFWHPFTREHRVPAGADHDVLEGIRCARLDVAALLDENERLRARLTAQTETEHLVEDAASTRSAPQENEDPT